MTQASGKKPVSGKNEIAQPSTPAEALWGVAVSRYSNFSSWRQVAGWFFFSLGLSARSGANRLAKMRRSASAPLLEAEMKKLSAADLAHFLAMASVNREQAEAAFRFTAITNFTIPLSVFLIANQTFPGWFTTFLEALKEDPGSVAFFASVVAAAFIGIVGIVLFAYAGVHHARDVHHLTLIEAGRRGGSVNAAVEKISEQSISVEELA